MAETRTAHLRNQRQKAIHEAIDALYAARTSGDSQEFASYFAADARMTIVGNPALSPGSGMRMGREGIARHIDMLHEINDYLGYTIDHVVMTGIMSWCGGRLRCASSTAAALVPSRCSTICRSGMA